MGLATTGCAKVYKSFVESSHGALRAFSAAITFYGSCSASNGLFAPILSCGSRIVYLMRGDQCMDVCASLTTCSSLRGVMPE